MSIEEFKLRGIEWVPDTWDPRDKGRYITDEGYLAIRINGVTYRENDPTRIAKIYKEIERHMNVEDIAVDCFTN